MTCLPAPPSSKDPFWSFSFHEMGVYDVPATIRHVLSATNRTRLDAYVGHSMGTTAFFVASHYYPDWIRDKVAVMVGLAPVARIDHLSSPIKHLISAEPQIKFLLDNIGQGGAFWTQSSIQAKISRFLCDKSSGVESSGHNLISGGQLRRSERRKQKETSMVPAAACAIPESAIFIIAGFNQDQMNMVIAHFVYKYLHIEIILLFQTLLPRILGHTPSGTSFRTLEHYTQIYKTRTYFNSGYISTILMSCCST